MQNKTIIFTLGDRGGTGKTTVAKLLWERLRQRPDTLAFDLDGTTGAFSQIYSDYVNGEIVVPQPQWGVTPLLLHAEDREGRDEAINALVRAEANVILVDMPATSLTVLERVEEDWSMFDVLDDAGIEVVTVNVVTPFKSSLQNVLRTLALAPKAKPIVVLNTFAGKIEHFFLWNGDATHKPSRGKMELAQRGGIEIILPALPHKQAILVDADDLKFSNAVATVGNATDRMYLHNWLKAVEATLAPVAEILCFEMVPA